MCCKRIVLPVRGGATIKARWPLPSGVSRSITRVVSGSGPVSSLQPGLGIDGRQLVEGLDVAVVFGRHAVDVDDFPQPRALLAAALLHHAVDQHALRGGRTSRSCCRARRDRSARGCSCSWDRGGSRSRWDAVPARRCPARRRPVRRCRPPRFPEGGRSKGSLNRLWPLLRPRERPLYWEPPPPPPPPPPGPIGPPRPRGRPFRFFPMFHLNKNLHTPRVREAACAQRALWHRENAVAKNSSDEQPGFRGSAEPWGIPGSLKKPESTPAPCGRCACGFRRPTETAKNLLGCTDHRAPQRGAPGREQGQTLVSSECQTAKRLGQHLWCRRKRKTLPYLALAAVHLAVWFTKTALACLGARRAAGFSSQLSKRGRSHAVRLDSRILASPGKAATQRRLQKISTAMRSSRVNSWQPNRPYSDRPWRVTAVGSREAPSPSRAAKPSPLLIPVDCQPSCHKGEAPKRSSFKGAGVCLLGRT